jgi:hypothetical protein
MALDPPPDPYHFIKDLKKFYRKSHGFIHSRKKALESKKAAKIFV